MTETVFDGPPDNKESVEVLSSPNPAQIAGSDNSAFSFTNLLTDYTEDFNSSVSEAWGSVDTAISREDLSSIPASDVANLAASLVSSPDVYSYPIDLNNDPNNPDNELVHSIVFKILARSNSRVGQVAQAISGETSPSSVTNQNRVSSENSGAVTAALGAGIGGLYTVRAAKKALTGSFGSAAGQVIKGGIATTAGATIGSMSVENTSLVELRTAIELYITQPPKVSYSANWENAEIGALGGAFARGDSPEFSVAGVLSGASGLGELAARGVIAAAANLPSELGLNGSLGDVIQATSKKVANPYKEQLFKYIDFRTFEYVYKFAPRSESELEHVMQIIQQFKYHMHPENDKNKLFLEYPSEFQIEYRYRGNRNEYLNKISNCALTDMEVNYGNQDSFTSFKGTRGAPAEINLRLQFTELETMTNDRIGRNYKDSF